MATLRATRNAVVFSVDANLFPAAAFAAARVARLNDRPDTEVIVFTDAATAEGAAGLNLQFMVRPLAVPENGKIPPHYFRFFIPDALPDTHGRLLYLDADTYAEDARIFRLFDLDLQSHAFGGVRDAVIAFVPGSEELSLTLGPGNTRYVNSGVLLIDAARFRTERTLRRLLKLAEGKRRGLHSDQSALNLLLKGAFLELSPAFNLMTPLWNSFVRGVVPPAVVHFTGMMKPWRGRLFDLDHPARHEMERYFPTSPWPDFLSRFFSVHDAMSAGPRPRAPSFDEPFEGKDQFLRYLRETQFADVTARLTALHLDRLPAAV